MWVLFNIKTTGIFNPSTQLNVFFYTQNKKYNFLIFISSKRENMFLVVLPNGSHKNPEKESDFLSRVEKKLMKGRFKTNSVMLLPPGLMCCFVKSTSTHSLLLLLFSFTVIGVKAEDERKKK